MALAKRISFAMEGPLQTITVVLLAAIAGVQTMVTGLLLGALDMYREQHRILA